MTPVQDTSPSDEDVRAFRVNGAVCLRGVMADWVDVIADGIARNVSNPSEFWAENIAEGETGRFFDDYCNWTRIPEFQQIVSHSPLRDVAAALMGSETVQFFHDHVLVKEPSTPKPTPWHSDAPYYFVDGTQTVSFWMPIDPVDDASLRVIAGSHLWERDVLPVKWLHNDDFYEGGDYLPVPDPDEEPGRFEVVEWPMQPGDVVAFHFRAVHGARGNLSTSTRRVLSMRFVGDDARYVERPGRTSPPFPGHGMVHGQRLRDDWFPFV